MPDHSMRERPYRPRTRVREEKRADVSATALTAQIIICIILVICAFAMKSLNPVEYSAIRAEYSAMLSDPGETAKALEWFTGSARVFSEALDGLKESVGLLPEKTENKPDEWEGIDIDEPEDELELPTVPTYDYLSELGTESMGAGGGVSPEGQNQDGQSIPTNSTLAPVYLSAAIKPPVTGPVTSEFAYRSHPVTGQGDFHTGLDVASPEGSPVLAALPGKVEETGWSDSYGNYIVLKHSENLKTSYSHCSEIIAREGMSVRQGERIALIGETGMATGPHLHFSVIAEGQFTDPLWVLADHVRFTS